MPSIVYVRIIQRVVVAEPYVVVDWFYMHHCEDLRVVIRGLRQAKFTAPSGHESMSENSGMAVWCRNVPEYDESAVDVTTLVSQVCKIIPYESTKNLRNLHPYNLRT